MSECIKYCGQCDKTDLPNIRDKEPIHIGYSYAYKTDCEGEAYIKAEEVKSLIEQARADAINEFLKRAMKEYICPFTELDIRVVACEELENIAMKMKEQNG